MALVYEKRPDDILDITVSFLSWLEGTDEIASVSSIVKGEDDDDLDVVSTTIDGAYVITRVSEGTARGIYQVYLTATFASGLKKRQQFEVAMLSAPENA